MNGVKAILKRSQLLRRTYEKLLWQKHKMSDWTSTHVFRSTRTVDTPHGFRLAAGQFIANRMMQDGTFEPEEIAIAKECLRDVDVFVDVGANIGYYTCLAGLSHVPVIAFEPQAQNLSKLYENVRLNGLEDVEIFPIALGAEVGIANLFGSSGPSASLLKGWAGYSSRYRQAVPVNRMDAVLLDRLRGRRAFVKIDVEGFEYQVLKGAIGLLRAEPKPIWLIEICLNEFHPAGANPDFEATFSLFFDAGYRVFTGDTRRTEISRDDVATWRKRNETPLGTFNYVMRP